MLLGLLAGALAKLIVPGKGPGTLVTITIGIVGAILGGFLGSFIGLGKIESFDFGGIVIATLGATLLLTLYRLFRKPFALTPASADLRSDNNGKPISKETKIPGAFQKEAIGRSLSRIAAMIAAT